MSDISPNGQDNVEDLPQARLVRAKDVGSPEVKAWRFADLAQEEVKKEEKVRSEVLEQIKRDAEPELQRQTTLLKKEAYEKAHQKGYDAGFEKGFSRGKEEALEQILAEERQALEPLVTQIQSILTQLKTPLKEVEEKVYFQLSELAIQIAQNFLKKEIEEDKQWVVEAVHQAVKCLPEEAVQLTIELHPDDVSIIAQYQQDFSEKWAIQSKPDIPRGSCRIKQDFSTIENIWQTQLAEYIQACQEALLPDGGSTVVNTPNETASDTASN